MSQTLTLALQDIRRKAIYAAMLAGIVSGVVFAFHREQFFESYLLAFVYWTGISLGCLALTMIHNLTGGAWGRAIRRVLDAATAMLPVAALFFVPVVLGMKYVFPWADSKVVLADEILKQKALYLNSGGFILRGVVYFILWNLFAAGLKKAAASAVKKGTMTDTSSPDGLQLASGLGLIMFGLTMTFASIDWMMSLEPHWISTIYGLIYIVNAVLSALALSIFCSYFLMRSGRAEISADQFHDLGNLLLAFVMLWAYMSISQFVIIWHGNLPEEITWYLRRSQGGWQGLIIVSVLFYFALPFFLLLMRGNKRNPEHLSRIALWILVVYFVQSVWFIMPSFYPSRFHFHIADLSVFLMLGGIWAAIFTKKLEKAFA